MSKFPTEGNLHRAKELFIKSQELQNKGQLVKAIDNLEDAFILLPTRDSIINNLLILYFTLKQREKLKIFLSQIQDSQKQYLCNVGHLYLDYLDENFQKCIDSAKKLLNYEEQSSHIQLYDILIKSYFKTHNISKVFFYSRKLLRDKSNYDQRLFAVGNILLCLSKPRAARWFIQKSLDISFNSAYAFDLGFCFLQLKDFKNGFKYWNNRFDGHEAKNKLLTKIPSIRSLDEIQNKKILIWSEQGIGDTLNFARYIKLLKEHSSDITFIVQSQLFEFFKKFYTDIKIFRYDDVNYENYDYQISLISLINTLGSTYKEIPLEKFEYTVNYKKRNNIRKVGFAHSGNPSYFRDSYRSINSDIFQSIFSINEIKFYKINPHFELYVKRHENVEDIGYLPIHDIANKLNDFDIILTTDTFLVHLCGFLNINCILLLNYNSDWRWFNDYKYTKWYSSVRILKQKNVSDWSNVIDTIKRFLRSKSSKKIN